MGILVKIQVVSYGDAEGRRVSKGIPGARAVKEKSSAVFRVPVELVKILKRDLAAAGIPYRDERGKTVDVHALRHTTATNLGRAKVAPRLAQKILRHSDIKLTLQVYTDEDHFDEGEALEAMPRMSLPRADGATAQRDPGPT
jgi:integrase